MATQEKKYYVLVNKEAYNAFKGVEERTDGVVPADSIEITKEKFEGFLALFLSRKGALRYKDGELIDDEYTIAKQNTAKAETRVNILFDKALALATKILAYEKLGEDTTALEGLLATAKEEYTDAKNNLP